MIVLFPTLVTTSPGSLIPRVSSLRIPAEPINFQTTPARDIHAIARALLQVMHSHEGGVGIAAPMIGFHLRLIAVHDRDSAPLILCNPRVTAASEVKVVGTEANLSIPGYLASSIPRPQWIAYAAQDLGGNAVEGRADGFLARIILHELDVLDGLAFFDHIGEAPTRLPSAGAKATDALSQALSSAVGNSIAGPSQAEEEDEEVGISTPVTVSPELLAVRDTVLRWRAREVNLAEWSSDRLRELVRRMFRIQYELEGVGLAAPQIGVSARLAVIDDGEGKPLVLINPEIIEKSPELEVGREGCLSLPGFSGQVSRSNAVTVKNVDVHGEEYKLKAEGYLARIIQHEVDHLDGVLYADHIENAPANLMSVDPHSKSLKSTDVVYRREQTSKD